MKTNHVKRTFALAASALAISTAVVGCRDYDIMDEEVAKAILDAKEFDSHFIETFGEPLEGHKWGTDKELKPITAFGTRALTRGDGVGAGDVDVNRNLWCYRQGGAYYKDNGHFLLDVVKVPGWPNFDGYYYTGTGNGMSGRIVGESTMMRENSLQPVGDVTDFEIQYVSTWFRTHKNPSSINLHLTDFFIQNVSQDNDQLSYNYYIDCGSASAPQGLPSYFMGSGGILDVTKTHNGENANRANDVVNGTTDGNIKVTKLQLDSNEELNYKMDYLGFQTMSGDWTHVNNFNRGNSNFNPEDNKVNSFREIKYVSSSGTENFTCNSSMNNGTQQKWVLVKLEWKEPGADGVVRDREGYYLAFDFAVTTHDTRIDYDGFYSNWIVKITPGYFVPGEHSARMMCEDLGGSFDFDFNDVVFDIANDNDQELIISVQAAGGTLPILIGYNSTTANIKNYEAHHLLDAPTTQPVNVDATPDKTASVAIYRIQISDLGLTADTDGKYNYYNIPIYVQQGDSWVNINKSLPTISSTEYGDSPNPQNSRPSDKTPRKFVTEVGVKWMKELTCIEKGYQKFRDWVTTGTMQYEVEDEHGNKRTIYWYSDVKGGEFRHEVPATIDGSITDPTTEPETWWDLHSIANGCPLQTHAIDVITIAKYPTTDPTNYPNSIIGMFRSKADKQQITFATFLKAKTTTVHAFMVPVWVVNDKPMYISNGGASSVEITETVLQNASSYFETYWQPHFTYYYNGSNLTQDGSNYDTGVDGQGNYTSVCKIAFKRSEMAYTNSSGEEVFCDYVMIFVKENLDSDGKPLETPVVKQHELYCIF